MTGERHHASVTPGQRLVERGGHGTHVLLAGKQGRSEPQLVKVGGGSPDRRLSPALEPAVDDVRSRHERPPDAAFPQVAQRLRQRRPHGPAARAGARHHVGTHGIRKLAHERRDSRVLALAGQAAGYDQRA